MYRPTIQKISDDLFRKKDWKLPNKLYIAFLAKMLRKNPKLYFLIFQFSSENVLLGRNHGILNKEIYSKNSLENNSHSRKFWHKFVQCLSTKTNKTNSQENWFECSLQQYFAFQLTQKSYKIKEKSWRKNLKWMKCFILVSFPLLWSVQRLYFIDLVFENKLVSRVVLNLEQRFS